MKKITFLLLLLGVGVLLKAQNFVYSTEMHINTNIEANVYESEYIKFKTPNPEVIQYKWKLIENTLPEAWDYSLCDHGSCYISIPNEGEMLELTQEEADDSTEVFFSLTLIPQDTKGTGTIRLYVYDSKDLDRGDTVSFTMTYEQSAGLLSNTLDNIVNMYPNPATDVVQLNVKAGNSIENVQIIDATGKTVLTKSSLIQNTLDVSILNPGIYSVQANMGDGIRLTKRLVIQ